MKSRYFFVILFFCVFFSFSAQAQEIKDGYIITPDGDFRYGVIELDPALDIHAECLFKGDRKNEFTKFTPAEIQGYGVIDGIRFITKEIEIGETSQKVFLKNESDGVARLYVFRNNRFFVDKDNFIELKAAAGDQHYKKVLAGLLNSCKNILSAVKKTALEKESLQKLFLRYERCTSLTPHLEPAIRVQTDFLAGGELSNTTVKFDNPTLPQRDFNLIDKTLLSVGINFLFTLKNKRQISYVAGVHYYDQRYYLIDRSTENTYSSVDRIHFSYREINIPIAVQYSFNKKEKKLMPFAKAGVTIPITFNSSLDWQNEKEYATAVYLDDYDLPQKFNQSIQLGISVGTTFSLISDIRNVLEITYQTTGGRLKDDSTRVNVNGNRIIILLGVRF